MYVESYNSVSHKGENHVLGTYYKSEGNGLGYVITVDGKVKDMYNRGIVLDHEGYNSMYAGSRGYGGEYYWWLSSPSNSSYGIYYIDSLNHFFNNSVYSGKTLGICPLIALKNGSKVEIDNEVTVNEERIAENPEGYYGKKVKNYNAGNQTYRIFFVDKNNDFGDGKNTIYLKADYSKDNVLCVSSYGTYKPTGENLNIYKRMNKSWSAQRESDTSKWDNNECEAARLCSPSNFKKYLDDTKANYAMGNPSLEMYIASYNQVSHKDGKHVLGTMYSYISDREGHGYAYIVDGENVKYSTSSVLDDVGYNRMYCGSENWWIASPSAITPGYICYVNSSRKSLDHSGFSMWYGLEPVVCIKNGIELIIEEEYN